MMFGVIGLTSLIATVASATRMWIKCGNFFEAVVSFSQSNASVLSLLMLWIYSGFMICKLILWALLGPLGPARTGSLNEYLRITITRIVVSLAVLGNEYGLYFAIMCSIFVFFKIFDWLSREMFKSLEQLQVPSKKAECKYILLFSGVLALLFNFHNLLVHSAYPKNLGLMLLLSFEYSTMSISIAKGVIECFLLMLHTSNFLSWEGRSFMRFYLDLAADLVKLIAHMVYFSLIVYNSVLPLHILWDMHVFMVYFVQRLRGRVKYNQATTNISERYSNATVQEIENCGKICCICLQEMVVDTNVPRVEQESGNLRQNEGAITRLIPLVKSFVNKVKRMRIFPKRSEVPKKLLCGHIFHFSCLRMWLERQQTCPTCRRPVVRAPEETSTCPQQELVLPQQMSVQSATKEELSSKTQADCLMLMLPEKRLYNVCMNKTEDTESLFPTHIKLFTGARSPELKCAGSSSGPSRTDPQADSQENSRENSQENSRDSQTDPRDLQTEAL